jgi:hypothetical protein
MTKFLGADVHQEILAVRVFAIEALDRILHRGSQQKLGRRFKRNARDSMS